MTVMLPASHNLRKSARPQRGEVGEEPPHYG